MDGSKQKGRALPVLLFWAIHRDPPARVAERER